MADNSTASAIAGSSVDSLAAFQDGLPVHLISTPRKDFVTCAPDETLSSVVARNRENFDYFPVVEPADGIGERIVGLVEITPFMRGEAAHGLVRDRMGPLSEENLIGADASLLRFIRTADRQPFRLIVSGTDISGLVSIYDVQQLPARAALFAMVTQLEMTMAAAIRREFGDADTWIGRLSAERAAKVRDGSAAAKARDAFVDELLFTQFKDKVTIIKKSPHFVWSKSAFEKELKEVNKLRDALAHANEYAGTHEDARNVCETVRQMDRWIERLTAWPRPARDEAG